VLWSLEGLGGCHKRIRNHYLFSLGHFDCEFMNIEVRLIQCHFSMLRFFKRDLILPKNEVAHFFGYILLFINSRRPGFDSASGQVGFVVNKVAPGQVFSEYFCFLCQSSFHQILHHHNHPVQATIGQSVAAVPNGPSWTTPPTKPTLFINYLFV
jgi:hypothetical protein